MEFPEVRLSDDERQEALDALSEHVRTGRLEIDEYGERSAQVTAARRRGDLEKLFADLPQPRPSVLYGRANPANWEQPHRPVSEPAEKLSPRRTVASLALPIAAIIAILLILTVAKTFAVFLIPIAVAVIGPAMFNRRKHR